MAGDFQKRKATLGKIVPLVLIGVGCIAIGLFFLSMLTKGSATEEFSVVPVTVHFSAPEITLNDLNGQKVSLSDYRDQVVLVNNWATWCPPCKLEMPTLQEFYQEHSQQGFYANWNRGG
jgi:thiol-disulfide isomerase/thioredoxin